MCDVRISNFAGLKKKIILKIVPINRQTRKGFSAAWAEDISINLERRGRRRMQNKGARQLSHALGLQPQTGMRTYTLAAAACKCRPL